MAYAVVRTDKMYGTDVRAGMVSLVAVNDSNASIEVQNGTIVALGALKTGEREVYECKLAKAADAGKFVLVASPEVMYDERKRNLDEFVNEAGDIARGYIIHAHDIFSVTKEAFDGAAPTVGAGVGFGSGAAGKLKVGGTDAKCIAIDVVGRYTYYVIEVA